MKLAYSVSASRLDFFPHGYAARCAAKAASLASSVSAGARSCRKALLTRSAAVSFQMKAVFPRSRRERRTRPRTGFISLSRRPLGALLV